MKRVLLAALLAASTPAAIAADWVETSPGSAVFYDASTVRSSATPEDVLFVDGWMRYIETNDPPSKIKTAKVLARCSIGRKVKLIAFHVMDMNGKLIDSGDFPEDGMPWMEVVPDTRADAVTKRLCRIAWERHLKPKKKPSTIPQQRKEFIPPMTPVPAPLATGKGVTL